MGKASSSKKVRRLADTGSRGRGTGRSFSTLAFPVMIGLVIVLGTLLIIVSRGDDAEAVAPTLTDHWHSAYGVWACDRWLPPFQDSNDPSGIHSHADGVIHIHPFSNAVSGKRATLDKFGEAVGMELSDSRVKVPDLGAYREGETDCDGKQGQLRVLYWEDAFAESDEPTEVFTEDLGKVRLFDRGAYAIVFAPRGEEIPKPPSVPQLNNLSDVQPEGQQPGSTVPNEQTTVPGESTDTSAPEESSETTESTQATEDE
jgi:hypothetical protein